MFHCDFKQKFSLEERKKEFIKTKHEKYKDKIPVIVHPIQGSRLPKIEKNKILITKTYSIAELIAILRKRITIRDTEALFVYAESEPRPLPSMSMTMAQLYESSKDLEDEFLYIYYGEETTFG